jgi:hypothetical protein
MNKLIHNISLVFVSVVMLFSVASCQLESPHNDKLDGYWHIEQIDSISKGIHVDKRESRVTWAVQARLLQIRDYDSDVRSIYTCHFVYEDQTLTLTDAYYDDRTIGDTLITDFTQIEPYGVRTIPVSYTIEQLSSERMILSDGTIRIYFRKL